MNSFAKHLTKHKIKERVKALLEQIEELSGNIQIERSKPIQSSENLVCILFSQSESPHEEYKTSFSYRKNYNFEIVLVGSQVGELERISDRIEKILMTNRTLCLSNGDIDEDMVDNLFYEGLEVNSPEVVGEDILSSITMTFETEYRYNLLEGVECQEFDNSINESYEINLKEPSQE